MIILGLGCNIGDRLANLREALHRLQAITTIKVLQVSPIYESDAMLLEGAPSIWNQPFLNLAICIATDLLPEQLLIITKKIERDMGRREHLKWSPRTIDIDILAWDDMVWENDKLKIPHPGLTDRPFALWPLADLIPCWKYCHPGCRDTGKGAEVIAKKFGSRFDGNAPLHTRQIVHRIDTPMMMGVLNLTLDSFSDGGKFVDLSHALDQAKMLFAAGADIIDVGAESTNPKSQLVSLDEEWSRLQPFLEAWPSLWVGRSSKPKLSVDTSKPEIVKKLLSYPVDFFNDQSGLTNHTMITLIKESDAKIVFMHNLGLPANSEKILPDDCDVVKVVFEWGEQQLEKLVKLGVRPERLIFDVGIGFGKSAHHSLELLTRIEEFKRLGVPLLVGHSRKSFMNRITAKKFSERDVETAVFSGFLARHGVEYLRVHNVDYNMRLLQINSILN